jgi:hypothetical protein
MSDFHSDYKQQLVTAAGALFDAPAARLKRRIGRPRHVPLLVGIGLGALLLAAAAFAATKIIGFGSPVTASRAPGTERPSMSTGIGIPVSGARSRPISAQLLAISVPDPGGGLSWGMRVVRTTRGLVCVQTGRLLDGRLGVLGQDGEFQDDGLFHELPVGALDPDTCSQPADHALYRAEMAAAGSLPGPTRACQAPGEPRTPGSGPPPCPAQDERAVAFGVLGPHAVSVSYKLDGHVRTVATVGSLGAYLIVLRPSPGKSDVWALGSSSGPLGSFPIETQSSLVSTLVFRFGDRRCQTGDEREPGGSPVCTKSSAHTPVFEPFIPRGLHARIAMTAHRTAGGYDLDLTFVAPVAVFDASTAYGVEVTMPRERACGHGGVNGRSIERDLARGQLVHIPQFVAQPPGCHGVVHGRVVLGRQPDGFTGPVDPETIGRFTFELP